MQHAFRLAIVMCSCFPVLACLAHSTQTPQSTDTPRATAQRPSSVRLQFESEGASFNPARLEYQRLWDRDRERILATVERIAGLRFDALSYPDTVVRAIVFEGVSHSGYRDQPMKLRASYTEETKRATLVHELGHRLLEDVVTREDDPHKMLFLWLYDAWEELWGREFADRQVAIERSRGGPYPAAWDFALAMSREQRAEAWRAHRELRMRRP